MVQINAFETTVILKEVISHLSTLIFRIRLRSRRLSNTWREVLRNARGVRSSSRLPRPLTPPRPGLPAREKQRDLAPSFLALHWLMTKTRDYSQSRADPDFNRRTGLTSVFLWRRERNLIRVPKGGPVEPQNVCCVAWSPDDFDAWSPGYLNTVKPGAPNEICYGAPIFLSWSPGAPHILGRSPGALNPFGTLLNYKEHFDKISCWKLCLRISTLFPFLVSLADDSPWIRHFCLLVIPGGHSILNRAIVHTLAELSLRS